MPDDVSGELRHLTRQLAEFHLREGQPRRAEWIYRTLLQSYSASVEDRDMLAKIAASTRRIRQRAPEAAVASRWPFPAVQSNADDHDH